MYKYQRYIAIIVHVIWLIWSEIKITLLYFTYLLYTGLLLLVVIQALVTSQCRAILRQLLNGYLFVKD